MTILDLTDYGCAIAPASNLSDVLLIKQSSESSTLTVPAAVMRFAGGRDRMISSAGRTDEVQVSFRRLTRAEYDSLDALIGTPTVVLFRDQRGRRHWGVASELSAVELRERGDILENVSFVLSSVTVSEIV